jgi:negative regulator of flagellin synthesis FlgM
MADPISGLGGRPVTSAKPDQLKGDPAQIRDAEKPNTASVVNLREDSVELSAEAKVELDRAGFDAAKVEQIKQALADGNYPIDARRIAEGFQDFEKLL